MRHLVYMSKSLRGHLVLLLVLVTVKLSIQSIAKPMSMDKNQVQFPDDFLNFLKGLGIKSMNAKSSLHTTTPKMKNVWNIQNSMNTQKAAFKDVLMMKLVSYYEDKYKLSHHKLTIPDNPSNDPEDNHLDAEVLIL